MEEKYHKPVMLQEVIEALQIEEGKKYIDCNLGDGGHSLEIMKLGGLVLGIDLDSSSISNAKSRAKELGLENLLTAVQGNFVNVDKIAKYHGFSQVSGVLYDLGYSSTQLDDISLGLSFLKDGPLDMRMDKSLGVSAADLVNALSEQELTRIFREFGEEHMAKRFAQAIVASRRLKKLSTTKDLVEIIVSEASPGYEGGRIHPATRVFQALRIAVNDELGNLKTSLPRAAQLILPGGRMAAISFHSLEDKTVKEFGRSARLHLKAVNKKPLVPLEVEVKENSRSRSAKLRVFERLN